MYIYIYIYMYSGVQMFLLFIKHAVKLSCDPFPLSLRHYSSESVE